MSGGRHEHDRPRPLNVIAEDASQEEVIAVLWQGVTVVFYPDIDHLDRCNPDDTITHEVEILSEHAKAFGMKQATRTIRDGCVAWLEVQWCWKTFGDATCASPYVPDGMEVLNGPVDAWSSPFLA